MKQIFRPAFLTFFMLFLLALNSVYAISDYSCSIAVRPDTGVVSIKGSIPAMYASESVVIQILNPGKQLQDLKTELMKDVVSYQEEVPTDASGAFLITYTMKDIPGDYTLYIGVRGEYIAYQTSFHHYGTQYLQNDFIPAINQAKANVAANSMKTLLADNYDKLAMNCTMYQDFISKGLHHDDFYLALAKNQSVSSLSELEAQIDGTIVMLSVNLATLPSEINDLFTTYHSYIGLDKNTAYATYINMLNDALRTDVSSKFLNKNFSKLDDVTEYFTEQTLVSAFNAKAETGWGSIKEFIEFNSQALKIDFTTFSTLKKPEAAYRMLEGKKVATLASIKEEFNKAVDAQYLIENRPTGGVTGGRTTIKSSIQPLPSIPKKVDAFNDLVNCEWAKESIEALYGKGIINGKSEKMFVPDAKITREELVKTLVLGAGLYKADAKADFKDVDKNAWHYTYIASSTEQGIITGKDGNVFGVGENITREDMAIIVYRTIIRLNPDLKNEAAQVDFSDKEDISKYAMDGVAFAQKAGIIVGTGGAKFSPKEYSTRAQAAVIVYRMMKLLQQ